MTNPQPIELEKDLNTNASSPNYITSLDSYLYNVRGIRRFPDRIKFIVRTTDLSGNGFSYTINGQTIVGVVLLVNPASVSINLSKIVNRTQTMVGWVEEHWGEELDTITFQGSSAAFIWGGPSSVMPVSPIDVNGQQYNLPVTQSAEELRNVYNRYEDITDLGTVEPIGPGDYSGLAVRRRRDSLAYKEFVYLMQMMSANAATFDIHGFVKDRLYIQISYDYAAYRGYFESIDITEDSATPFKFIYTITFKSEKTIYSFLR